MRSRKRYSWIFLPTHRWLFNVVVFIENGFFITLISHYLFCSLKIIIHPPHGTTQKPLQEQTQERTFFVGNSKVCEVEVWMKSRYPVAQQTIQKRPLEDIWYPFSADIITLHLSHKEPFPIVAFFHSRFPSLESHKPCELFKRQMTIIPENFYRCEFLAILFMLWNDDFNYRAGMIADALSRFLVNWSRTMSHCWRRRCFNYAKIYSISQFIERPNYHNHWF